MDTKRRVQFVNTVSFDKQMELMLSKIAKSTDMMIVCNKILRHK